jgi:pimeloyl-ACP methyl ester carboxylesterase
MGSLAVPGSPLLKAAGAAWRSEDVKAVLAQLGRGAALNIASFFNFDKDYGYVGAAEQKKLNPYNTWTCDLASWASLFQYDPPEPLEKNTKPILYTAGGKDELAPREALQALVAGIGGAVRIELFPDAGHQLMLFETEIISNVVHAFCLENIPEEST